MSDNRSSVTGLYRFPGGGKAEQPDLIGPSQLLVHDWAGVGGCLRLGYVRSNQSLQPDQAKQKHQASQMRSQQSQVVHLPPFF